MRDSSATKRINMFLSNEEADFLNKNYNLCNRFTHQYEFVEDFKLAKVERFFLPNVLIKINLRSFQIKNTVTRDLITWNRKSKKIIIHKDEFKKMSIKFIIKKTLVYER